MAPTEAEILENFLLPPAPLQNIITLKEFAALFPRSARDHPEISVLYGEIQEQRAQDIQAVKDAIKKEIRRGKKERQQVANARREAEDEQRRAFGVEETRPGQIVSARPVHCPSFDCSPLLTTKLSNHRIGVG
jgi:centromere-localized protein 2